ncbi:MAG TPA: flagellar basal body rod protein FlgB [Rhodospirillaceae bacterium]|nr:MAG: hypothetical protein A2018_05350 [Alphaproteobacteria bacterium GWF2_58_20]HAU28941.1 flagellar basal body rod protein FlgB [Rhodospirillaceae bacterium]
MDVFRAMGQKMAWLAERQKILAQNVANSDTPNYRPQDLAAEDFHAALSSAGRMAATQPGHIQPSGGQGSVTVKVVEKGKAVLLEEQMAKVSETAVDYQLMTNLYRKHMSMLKTALGRGGQ